MANENKMHDLIVEKTIPKNAAEVFRAIGEGRLFLNCSADTELLKIDFKVGGKYSIEFLNYNMKNHGEFLEIIPNQKIVFTWCQDYDSNPIPDTKVVIILKDVGGKTALTLTHTGFTDLENKDAHQGGWNGGLDDLREEISNGKLRLARKYSLPVEKLYEICKSPKSEITGDVIESVPNKKIVIKMGETKVTLLFDTEDDKSSSWIELLHEGLKTETQQKTQRAGWDSLLKQLK
ncbi:MAG: SRPBCC family protein [Oligoflexia bacterium]|nr:SRPBCC family protein [Oligoflexia bacterium]